MNDAKIPKLRFPGFEEEWEEKKLGEIFDRVVEKNKENNQNVLTISAQYGLVNQLEYFKKIVASKDLTGYYLLHKGDFAYNKSKSQGYDYGAIKPLKQYEKGVASTLYICFRCKDDRQIDYWEQYFDSCVLDSQIASISQEGARNHGLLNISVSEFFNEIMVYIPQDSLEQKKIANFLSSVDEEIEGAEKKLEGLKEHKKGLMEKLFPRNGETVPQYRFPEFDGEWEEKKLGEIGYFFKGKGIAKDDVVENGKIKCIRYGELYTHYHEIIEDVISSTNIDAKNLLMSYKNDVIIPASGETQEDISTASCVMKDGIALGGDINIIRLKNDNGVFLAYYLNNVLKWEIAKVSQGVSIIHLKNDDLKRLHILIPTKKEQEKIAQCLNSIDEQISLQEELVEGLKEHKKGLMQQLFPQN